MLGADERLELVLAGASLAELSGRLDKEPDVLILTPGAIRSFDTKNNLLVASQSAVLLLAEDDLEELADLPVQSGRPWGFLPAGVDVETLIAAVHALAEGLAVAPPAWLAKRLKQNGGYPAKDDGTSEALTPRESEVLQQLANGLTNKQIAYALGISENTVKYHISSIYAKLGVMNRAEAVRAGMRQGWIAI